MTKLNKISELNKKLKVAEEALIRASEADGYESHDDSVGYRICCGVSSYKKHRPDCYLIAALNKLQEGT